MNSVLVAAVMCAMASLLLVRGPSGRLSRLDGGSFTLVPPLRGRPGAPPWSQRVIVGVAVSVVLALLIEGPPGWVAGVAVGSAAAVGLGWAAPRPTWWALADELPDALDFLAVCLEAGLPTAHAVAEVAKVSPPGTRELLGEVAAQLELGRTGPAAWESLRGHPVWGATATDIGRAERTGTALAGVLRDHAEDARQEARDRAARRARTVGVRSVLPLMACFLPAFMAIGVVPIIASLMTDFFG
ncbi:type II secretion system F family protein [Tessaracoccus sp. G1721]